MANEFFPARPESRPTIYAYQDSNPQYDGQLKVGYTTRTARERLDDIYNIKTPGPKPYKIVLEESAMRQGPLRGPFPALEELRNGRRPSPGSALLGSRSG